MSENVDPKSGELQDWMNAWQENKAPQAGEPAPDALLEAQMRKIRKSSQRFGLGLLALTIGEIVFCVAMLALAAYFLAQKTMPLKWVTFGTACFLVAVAEYFVLKNRRGTYRPKNQTTQAFIELEWLRGKRQLHTIRWILPFVIVEIILIGGLRIWEMASDPLRAARTPELVLSLLLFILCFFLLILPILYFWRRHVLRKLKEIEPLREAFAGKKDSP